MAQPALRQDHTPPPAGWQLAWSALDRVEDGLKHLRNMPGEAEAMALVLRLRAQFVAMLEQGGGHDA